MSLTKWNPFSEMEHFFENYPSGLHGGRGEASRVFGSWSPVVDISETPDEFVIKAELPAVDKEDINLEMDNGIMTLTGERRLDKDHEHRKHHRIERFFGRFSRSFVLPDTVDEDHVRAEFKNGLLTVTLLKSQAPEVKSVKINIK